MSRHKTKPSGFKYLGSVLSPNGDTTAEMNRRIGLAAAAFLLLQTRFLGNRSIPLNTRVNVFKSIVVPTLTYGAAESWAPTAQQLHRLDTFQRSCLRRMVGVRLSDRVSNEELHERTRSPPVSTLIAEHRQRWAGHVLRRPDALEHKLLFALAPQGQLAVREGRRPTITRCMRMDMMT